MTSVLNGATAMGGFVAGLLFLRFWRETRDSLFLMFSLAFWIFAVDYGLLGLVPFADESRQYVFLLRLVGFLVLLYGIVMKNRTARPR